MILVLESKQLHRQFSTSKTRNIITITTKVKWRPILELSKSKNLSSGSLFGTRLVTCSSSVWTVSGSVLIRFKIERNNWEINLLVLTLSP